MDCFSFTCFIEGNKYIILLNNLNIILSILHNIINDWVFIYNNYCWWSCVLLLL
jgi:hypothetical protein